MVRTDPKAQCALKRVTFAVAGELAQALSWCERLPLESEACTPDPALREKLLADFGECRK